MGPDLVGGLQQCVGLFGCERRRRFGFWLYLTGWVFCVCSWKFSLIWICVWFAHGIFIDLGLSLELWVGVLFDHIFLCFFRGFQRMAFTPDDSSLLSNQNKNRFFLCKLRLNLKSIIQLSKTLLIELNRTHLIASSSSTNNTKFDWKKNGKVIF